MEPHFDADFSSVRVHIGPEARAAAQVLRADAFTIGSHIFFAEPPDPATSDGRSLLAHELTHVMQQSGAAVTNGQASMDATPTATFEREAENMAGLVAGRTEPQPEAFAGAHPASRITVATTPLGPMLRGAWRKEGQGFLDCVNECLSSQGFAATVGGLIVGVCGVIAALAAAAVTPETAGTATVPTAVIVAAACAGAALGVPTGLMAGCLWECRG